VFIYSEFDTTPANLVADLKAKILTSSDYSNPTANIVKATTPLGAVIAMDLNTVAPSTTTFQPTVYRNWTGGAGTGVDPLSGRLIMYKRNATGSTSNILHVRVAAGSTLLYIDIEGPRQYEANADSGNYGSIRQCVCLSEMTPYFSGAIDPVPAVVLGGSTSYQGVVNSSASQPATVVNVSRDAGNQTSWVQGHLGALTFPSMINSYNWHNPSTALDGSDYLSPYVVFEDVAGMRGRLTDVFFAGWYSNVVNNSSDTVRGFTQGDTVSYGGKSYKILAPYKSESSTYQGGSFGVTIGNNGSTYMSSPLIAVRTS